MSSPSTAALTSWCAASPHPQPAGSAGSATAALTHQSRAGPGLCLLSAPQVCNAGGSAATSYIPNASVEEFSATYDMNVKSTYMCAQSAARHAMIAQSSGKIITLGSIHGILSGDLRLYDGLEGFNRSGPPYQAAKGAVVRLSPRPGVSRHHLTTL